MLLITFLPIIRYYTKHYNIAERNHALWLAYAPDPFASGLHADISLFTFLRQSFFFFSSTLPVVILQLILLLKTWKHLVPLLDMTTLNYQISTLTCLAHLHLSPLRDLQIWASGSWIIWLNKDIQRRPKKQQTGLFQLFEVSHLQ